jgi:hypothetical protein
MLTRALFRRTLQFIYPFAILTGALAIATTGSSQVSPAPQLPPEAVVDPTAAACHLPSPTSPWLEPVACLYEEGTA